jgi:hypothetical protein
MRMTLEKHILFSILTRRNHLDIELKLLRPRIASKKNNNEHDVLPRRPV